MKSMKFSELKNGASDRFSSILLFCPNWPPLAQTSTTEKFTQLIGFIDTIVEHTKSNEAKQWLRICLQEVRQSWKSYEDGNLLKGKDLIQQAEEHFENAFSKKPIEARFIAGRSGATFEKDFPNN
jgi:hypothetical protein